MGGYQREKKLYLNVVEGRLQNKKLGIYWDGYSGRIVGIDWKAGEYLKQKTMRIQITMFDEQAQELAVIQFGEDTWFALTLFSRLVNVELDKPVLIGAYPLEANKKVSKCYMKQLGQKVEGSREFTQPIRQQVGAKTVTDWTPCIATYHKMADNFNLWIAQHPVALPQAAVNAPVVEDEHVEQGDAAEPEPPKNDAPPPTEPPPPKKNQLF